MLTDQQLLAILAGSKDATAIYDTADLRIRFVNSGMLALWGKDAHILGLTFEDALPELHDQPFTALLKQVWHTGQTYNDTDTPASLVIGGKLTTSWFDFEFRPISDEHGRTIAIIHTAIDVTSRMQAWQQVAEKQRREQQLIEELSTANQDFKAANERLLESETDFKRLVAQAPVAILVFRGPDMVIDLANQAMLQILGKGLEVIGNPLLHGLPELKGEPAAQLLFDVFHTGKPADGSEVLVRMNRDGIPEDRYFNFSYRPQLDNGKIVGVMDLAVEVTAQVLARKHLEQLVAEKTVLEQSLRSNQQRLQSILDTMAEGLIIVDTDCKPTYVNMMAQRILGQEEPEIKNRAYNDGKWHNMRVDGTELPPEDHPLNAVLRTGFAVYDQEVAIRLSSGDVIFISINAAPIVDETDKVTGAIATFTDVTNRRKILQQKEDFISIASHELKTPVASLKAALQLLSRMKDNIRPDAFAMLTDQANKSLNKLNELINSLLNSNRISQGLFPIHKTNFSIGRLLNDCCEHIRTAGTHQIILKGDIDLQIHADEQQLDQVMVNLVNNAVKYAHNSRDIIVTVQKLEKELKISVTDFGPGIAPDKIGNVFERYYRTDYGGVQFSGLGLGLYIAAEIIKKHGGQIGVESQLGKGSTFWFTLPL